MHALYSPTSWPDLASELAEFWSTIHGGATRKRMLNSATVSSNGLTTRRRGISKREADPDTFDYALQAITCADAADSGNHTTKDVFNSIIDAARNVSQMCKLGVPHLWNLSADRII